MITCEHNALSARFALLAADAGRLILKIKARGAQNRLKADASPVTEADEAAEALVLEGLEDILPGVPVLAEEEAAAGRIPLLGKQFLLVDPLDGTKEFIAGGKEYTVNIALIDNGLPVAGAVIQPETETSWWGGTTAFKQVGQNPAQPIRVRTRADGGLIAVVSRSHFCSKTEAWLARHGIAHRIDAGSSLKFCRVSDGSADVYVRHTPVMEWDTAAGHAVLIAAGGFIEAIEGTFGYGFAERGFIQGPFAAWGGVKSPA
jgi:3'(2'), 5'-bisphosphate nucleotidase